jgi:LacI family transcriptional regulator
MRKVTIEDVSRTTGLSRGTVSRALNDRPDISAETKQRVLKACKELDYHPSHAARSLATGRNYAVAALVTQLGSAFTTSFLRGAIGRAEQDHYIVHIVDLRPGSPTGDRLRSFAPERIDGVLNTVPLDAASAAQLRRTLGNRILTSCQPLDGVPCDVLMPDEIEAGRMATRFLLQNGSREILYAHRPATSAAADRLAGFQEICREHGIDARAATATIPDAAALDALGPRLERADAVIATDDFLAISIMLLGERMGRRPGTDLAVMGHGNEPVASAIHPTLTTIDSDGEGIGRRAMETVLQRMGQKRMDKPQHTRVAPLLIERESTGQPVQHT